MSSEPKEQPAPEPRRRPERAEDPGAWQPDPARDHDLAAAELGYDPDDPATWPGNAPPAPAESAPATGPAEAQDDDDGVQLTDATVMRALAHPVRMALLELLSIRETLTATQASEALGESPANCAFHLRTLAKYGFVHETGGGKGRERPWALTNRSISVETEQADPQAALAAEELVKVYFERWVDRARRGLSVTVPGWAPGSGYSGHAAYLTPAETMRLRNEMRRLVNRYEERRANPALRPEGALPVEWMIFSLPVLEWADAANPKAAPEHYRAWTPAPGADPRDADDSDASDD